MEKNSELQIISHIKQLTTFQNKNNFTEYLRRGLPKSNLKIFYATKHSILKRNKNKNKNKNYSSRKCISIENNNHVPTDTDTQLSNYVHAQNTQRERVPVFARKRCDIKSVPQSCQENSDAKFLKLKRKNILMSDDGSSSVHESIPEDQSTPRNINHIDSRNTHIIHTDDSTEDRPFELKKCLICNWRFPCTMNQEEKNAHVNFCIEGHGEEHKLNYISSIKVVNISSMENNNNNNNHHHHQEESAALDKCFVCGKSFKFKREKLIRNHILKCLGSC